MTAFRRLVIRVWSFIRNWSLGFGHSLPAGRSLGEGWVIGHWSLVILAALLVSTIWYITSHPLPAKAPVSSQTPSFSALPAKEIITSPKPADLIEQPLDSSEEGFEVLATKLDPDNNIYQLAF